MDGFKKISTAGWVLIVGFLLVLTLFFFPPVPSQQNQGSVEESSAISVGQVTSNPEDYYGKEVAVVGVIDSKISNYAFSIKERGSKRSFLVLTRQSFNENDISINQAALVLGKVYRFRINDMNNELGKNLENGKFNKFENQPAAIATQISLAVE